MCGSFLVLNGGVMCLGQDTRIIGKEEHEVAWRIEQVDGNKYRVRSLLYAVNLALRQG